MFNNATPPTIHGVTKFDFLNQSNVQYLLPSGTFAGEFVFCARENASSEDDGYLITFAHNALAGFGYIYIYICIKECIYMYII